MNKCGKEYVGLSVHLHSHYKQDPVSIRSLNKLISLTLISRKLHESPKTPFKLAIVRTVLEILRGQQFGSSLPLIPALERGDEREGGREPGVWTLEGEIASIITKVFRITVTYQPFPALPIFRIEQCTVYMCMGNLVVSPALVSHASLSQFTQPLVHLSS